MAKKKQQLRLARKPVRRPRRGARTSNDTGDSLDLHAAKAAVMYADPCGADLVPTVYPGDRGYINRFNNVFEVATGATQTAGMWVAKPGVNVGYNVGLLDSSATAFTTAFVDTQMPGAGFFNANARKIRCAGFCTTIRVNATVNNATGAFYYGVIPAQSIIEGQAFTSLSQIIPLLSHMVAASQVTVAPLEICWSPGAFDDRYCQTTTVTGDDDSDRNILVVIAVGLPSASGYNVRNTAIYEWTPVATTIDSTSVTPSRCDFGCILRNLKRKDPEWWWKLGTKGVGVASSILGAYSTGGIGKAAVKMASYL